MAASYADGASWVHDGDSRARAAARDSQVWVRTLAAAELASPLCPWPL